MYTVCELVSMFEMGWIFHRIVHMVSNSVKNTAQVNNTLHCSCSFRYAVYVSFFFSQCHSEISEQCKRKTHEHFCIFLTRLCSHAMTRQHFLSYPCTIPKNNLVQGFSVMCKQHEANSRTTKDFSKTYSERFNLVPRISLYKYQPITNWAVKSYEQWCNNNQLNKINVNKCWQLFVFSFSNLGLVVSELSRLVDVVPRHLATVLLVNENIFSSWITLAFTLVCTQSHLSHLVAGVRISKPLEWLSGCHDLWSQWR